MGVHASFFGARAVVGPLIGGAAMGCLPGGSRTTLLLVGVLILPGAAAIWLLRGRMRAAEGNDPPPERR